MSDVLSRNVFFLGNPSFNSLRLETLVCSDSGQTCWNQRLIFKSGLKDKEVIDLSSNSVQKVFCPKNLKELAIELKKAKSKFVNDCLFSDSAKVKGSTLDFVFNPDESEDLQLSLYVRFFIDQFRKTDLDFVFSIKHDQLLKYNNSVYKVPDNSFVPSVINKVANKLENISTYYKYYLFINDQIESWTSDKESFESQLIQTGVNVC